MGHVLAGSSCFKLHNATRNKVEPMEIKKIQPKLMSVATPSLTVAHMLLQCCMTEANMNSLFFLLGSSVVSGWYYSPFFIHSSQCMLLGTRACYPLATSHCRCPNGIIIAKYKRKCYNILYLKIFASKKSPTQNSWRSQTTFDFSS